MQAGSTVAGRYTIEALLGRGGMGSVWIARDVKFGERVALKLATAPGALHEEWKARFVREARLGSRLGKTVGFVRAFDWGELEGQTLYLAMDLIPGARPLDLVTGTLEERLARLATAARLVALAHAKGVVHRDLKPANFLQGEDGGVSLADFGLAKAIGETEETGSEHTGLTASGVGMGTPAFMPPEQFEDSKRVDERADVYALGVMLFLALTGGRLPYDGTAGAIVQRQTKVSLAAEPAPRPSALAPGVDPALEALCLRAIDLDRAKRLASVADLLAGIDAFLARGTAATLAPVLAPSAAPTLAPVHAPAPAASQAPTPAKPAPRERSHRLGTILALAAVLGLAASWPWLEGWLDVLLTPRAPDGVDTLSGLAVSPPPSPAPSPSPAAADVRFLELAPRDGETVLVAEPVLSVKGRVSSADVGFVYLHELGTPATAAAVDPEGRFAGALRLPGPTAERSRHEVEIVVGTEGHLVKAHVVAEVAPDPPAVSLEPIAAWSGGELDVRARVVGARVTQAHFTLAADGKAVAETDAPVAADGSTRATFAGTSVPGGAPKLEVRVLATDGLGRPGRAARAVAVDAAGDSLEVLWPPADLPCSEAVNVRVRVHGRIAQGTGFVAVNPTSPGVVLTQLTTDPAGRLHAVVHLPDAEGPALLEVSARSPSGEVLKASVLVARAGSLDLAHGLERAGGDPGLLFGVGKASIVAVIAGSSASKAGLSAGDEIVALDGEPVASSSEVQAVLRSKRAGEWTRVGYVRDGATHEAALGTPEKRAPAPR